jgi:hypothetical protein
MVVRTIKSEEYLAYQKDLKKFMQKINPKPTLAEIKQLKEDYLKKRSMNVN